MYFAFGHIKVTSRVIKTYQAISNNLKIFADARPTADIWLG